jgi:magnesium transporter
MLSLYILRDGRLSAGDATGDIAAAAWIDLRDPTLEEEKRVEQALGIAVPTREEIAAIEPSSRLYVDNDALYMTASLLLGEPGLSSTAPVTFILTAGHLLTVRYADPAVLRVFIQQAQKNESGLRNAGMVFTTLLEAIVDRTADVLEKIGAATDAVSLAIFEEEVEQESASRDYKLLLRRLGRTGDLNSKVRESLVSVGRVVSFLAGECETRHPELVEAAHTMTIDIRSLSDHSSYVAGTITFLLDALLGLINIEQNAIIRIVSVVSVLIMPPTLVASLYGMNFNMMPELSWRFGYPFALTIMVLVGLIPYLLFKRRGWL